MLPIMNLILNLIGLVIIPTLIVFGILRPKITPKEKLKDKIELEIHNALSMNSNEFCGASSYSYQFPHTDVIKSYGISGNQQLRFVTIPTNANVNFFTQKREIG